MINSLQALLFDDSIDPELLKPGSAWSDLSDIAKQQLQIHTQQPSPSSSPEVIRDPAVTVDVSQNFILSDETMMMDSELSIDPSFPIEADSFSPDKFPSWLRDLEDSMAFDGNTHFHADSNLDVFNGTHSHSTCYTHNTDNSDSNGCFSPGSLASIPSL